MRVLEETKKEKVPFLFSYLLSLNQLAQARLVSFPLAAAEQPVRDGENEGGAREKEVLLSTGGAQRKGEGEEFIVLETLKRNEYYTLYIVVKTT